MAETITITLLGFVLLNVQYHLFSDEFSFPNDYGMVY